VSKLCAHFQGMPELTTEATEIVRASQMPWVKGVDVHRWHCAPSEMFPGKKVLARCYMAESAEATYLRGGVPGMRLYFQYWKSTYEQLRRGGVVAVEGPNEHYPDLDWLGAYLDGWCEWIGLVGEMGLRPVWTTSTGRPALEYYHDARPTAGDFAPIWNALEDNNGIWGAHEYGAPDLRSCAPHLMGRYRLTLDEMARYTDAADDVPVIVSECGIDGGVTGDPAQVSHGWKYYTDAAMYQDQLAWYDGELAKDARVLAATPFTTCPTAKWASFDINGDMLAWMASRYDATPPEPPEPPAPDLDAVRREIEAAQSHLDAALGMLG
jgi:hypothetical protein